MAGIAKVSILGNVGRDPETRYNPQGRMLVQFSVAVNKWRQDTGNQQEASTSWFRISCFGNLGETMDRLTQQGSLKSGSQVFVSGTLEVREYQDKNGVTRTSLDVFADSVQLAGARSESNPEAGTQPPF